MPRFDQPGVASWGPDRLDVVLRSASSTLLHVFREGATTTMLDMGGAIAGAPMAVTRGAERLDVFARDFNQRLLWWSWSKEARALVGPRALPGCIASDPVVVALGTERIMIFAHSIDGPLRYWASSVDDQGAEDFGPPRIKDEDPIARPAIVSRSPHGVDVVVGVGHSGTPEWWKYVDGAWKAPVLLPGEMPEAPTMLTSISSSGNFPRLDVYVRGQDGRLKHWGFGFFHAPGSPSGWFGPEASVPEPFLTKPFPITTGDDSIELLARGGDGTLVHWSWDARARAWGRLQPGGEALQSDPAGVSRAAGTMDVFAWAGDRSLHHWTFAAGTWAVEQWTLDVVRPTPLEDELAAGLDDTPPEYLIVRAADQLVLGLTAPGFVRDPDGARLIAQDPDARLIVTFPPQHVVEGVVNGDDSFPPAAVSPSRLSGPSRIGFTPAAGTVVGLSTTGILQALTTATVSVDPIVTRVELPFGLAFTPGARNAEIHAKHPIEPLDVAGANTLWRTDLHADNAGDLGLMHVVAGRTDVFEPPLGKAERFFIKVQTEPALARRVSLTSIGGSLDATGRWPHFSWDQRIVLGRDQEVRTAVEGVLFPTGHRAVYEQVTRRSGGEATAVLRKSRQLIVLEPVRRHGDATSTPALINSFPFDGVEIMTRRFTDMDDASWHTVPREALTLAEANDTLAQMDAQVAALTHAVYGGEGVYMGGPVVEDRAAAGDEAASEYVGWQAARAAQSRIVDLIVELGLGTEDHEVFFQPHTAGQPVPFPIRCFGAGPDVHFNLKMWFVADIDIAGDLRAPLHSLADARVLAAVEQAHAENDDGIVELPGVPIDLAPELPAQIGVTRSDPAVNVRFQEVRRLNIVGNALDRGFLPTLGLPQLPNVPHLPADPRAWAAEVGMASLRSLLDTDPAVRLRYAADYAASRVSQVPFGILGRVVADGAVEQLKLNFAEAKDRVGALAAPNMVADGISRAQGLINVAAQVASDAQGMLDPGKLFDEGASLFGFDLRDLVTNIKVPPEIKTLLLAGGPPTVEMNWSGIELKATPADKPVFVPDDASSLSIKVVNTSTKSETTCTLGGFGLNMPPGEPLINVHFSGLEYRQVLGETPTLKVGNLTATLVGKLALLQVLQERVGLGDKLPNVHVTASQADATFQLPVPDVQAFSFVMSNLLFSAGLTVPFTPDPVALRLGFASREKPFTLTVLMFGGGGYVDLELTYQGLRRLEISLQFGAAIALNLGVAKAEVHAFGGIRYALLPDRSVSLTGYIQIGGSVELLGLISVAIELRVELDYRSDNSLVGRAKLVIAVDLTLYSHRFELDSGEWRIFGGPAGHARLRASPRRFVETAALEDDAPGLEAWQAYRRNFA
ncbi:hypothetical protein [Sphingomonas sp. BK580]|uniref:hypothetical protein n=1 Tax=Sphingomonas sp. BK580 TaxID=2586972 RepID=UPI00161CCBCF|nr:hypothetical protein [Sphingomonas sp. BK580]MBB3693170.1 hypothetical protein [Sphingomonas sp. BK580]